MADIDQNNSENSGKSVNNYLKYTGVGLQMAVIIGICTFIGYKIDQYAHHSTKWVTAVLSLFGVFAALFVVIKSLKD